MSDNDETTSLIKILFSGIARECLALGYSPEDIAFAGISLSSALAYGGAPSEASAELLISCAIDDGFEHKGWTMQQVWDGEATKC